MRLWIIAEKRNFRLGDFSGDNVQTSMMTKLSIIHDRNGFGFPTAWA